LDVSKCQKEVLTRSKYVYQNPVFFNLKRLVKMLIVLKIFPLAQKDITYVEQTLSMNFKPIIVLVLCMFQLNAIAQKEISVEEIWYYDGIHVFPNPATDYVSISYGASTDSGIWIDFEYKGVVDIYSLDGNVVRQNIQLIEDQYIIDIPLPGIKGGIYFVAVTLDDNEPVIIKIAKI
jgi:hypothetical protein